MIEETCSGTVVVSNALDRQKLAKARQILWEYLLYYGPYNGVISDDRQCQYVVTGDVQLHGMQMPRFQGNYAVVAGFPLFLRVGDSGPFPIVKIRGSSLTVTVAFRVSALRREEG